MLSDNVGNIITVDSTGAVTYGGNCLPTTCVTDTVNVTTSGLVIWSGSIGAFSLSSNLGATKPLLAPLTMDTSLFEVAAGSAGVLTVKWSDVGFTAPGPTIISMDAGGTIIGSGSVTFSAYNDNTNALFGTGTLVGTAVPLSTSTFAEHITGAGATASPFSMTEVVTFDLGAGTHAGGDFQITGYPSPTSQLTVVKTPDSATITPGSVAGFTMTISNTGGATATGLSLTDPLPSGGNEFFKWSIDATTGNPGDFTIIGSPGSQSLAFSSAFLAGSDSLDAGQSISVHITTPTTVGDVSGGAVGIQSGVSSSAYLGDAGNYGVLYIVGSSSHNLQITNVTLGANIGVGSAVGGTGVGHVNFNGPGIITGRLDFAPGQTNQFSNNNGANVGPASVNNNVSNVASAISTVTSLSIALGGMTGTPIAINGTQTINESAGALHTVNGVTYSVFTVTSCSEGDGKVLTINGDGSGNPVVFNFASNNNINLGGDVALTGNGLNDDKVIWNFTSSNQNIALNNNASSYYAMAFHGIILAPSDGISLVNANLSGRVFGGDNHDMQLVSGLTLHAPIMNTATVTGGNVSSASSSAIITIIGSFLPYAHFI